MRASLLLFAVVTAVMAEIDRPRCQLSVNTEQCGALMQTVSTHLNSCDCYDFCNGKLVNCYSQDAGTTECDADFVSGCTLADLDMVNAFTSRTDNTATTLADLETVNTVENFSSRSDNDHSATALANLEMGNTVGIASGSNATTTNSTGNTTGSSGNSDWVVISNISITVNGPSNSSTTSIERPSGTTMSGESTSTTASSSIIIAYGGMPQATLMHSSSLSSTASGGVTGGSTGGSVRRLATDGGVGSKKSVGVRGGLGAITEEVSGAASASMTTTLISMTLFAIYALAWRQ